MSQESRVGAHFLLDLRVGYPLEKAMQSDDVADTLDYAKLYGLVRNEMEIPSKLLEHVAGRIVNTILEAFPMVTSIDLSLSKENPPMGADCAGAGVEIHLINDKTK
jgi:dihydroneopterin aldolase